jgi:uncharacterized protein YjbI with pentapeptide repeats
MSIIKTTLQTLVAAIARAAEVSANKISTWQTTPDNSHFGSEKLVKDSLDLKVDKETGKGLSANDFDTTAKGKVDNCPSNTQTSLDLKVDKITGKELSTNDFTDALEIKLGTLTALPPGGLEFQALTKNTMNDGLAWKSFTDIKFIINLLHHLTTPIVLSGAIIQGTNNSGVYNRVDLSNLFLDNIKFDNSTLTVIDFTDTSLLAADFSGSTIQDNLFIGCRLQGSLFVGAFLDAIIFTNANMSGADFTNAVFANGGVTSFMGATLEEVIFTGAAIRNCNFAGADLTNAVMPTNADTKSEFKALVGIGNWDAETTIWVDGSPIG